MSFARIAKSASRACSVGVCSLNLLAGTGSPTRNINDLADPSELKPFVQLETDYRELKSVVDRRSARK
jgi:hypothetical protein